MIWYDIFHTKTTSRTFDNCLLSTLLKKHMFYICDCRFCFTLLGQVKLPNPSDYSQNINIRLHWTNQSSILLSKLK